jgi:hypothetical protein
VHGRVVRQIERGVWVDGAVAIGGIDVQRHIVIVAPARGGCQKGLAARWRRWGWDWIG